MRELCIFATHHQFQSDVPMDSHFHANLHVLIGQHKIDTICEEATGLTPKSCVELLADELGLKWRNIDLSIEERKLTPDTGDGDSLQDLNLYEQRESAWVERISEAVANSGLLICGLCHAFTIAEKLRDSFELEVRVYDPRRIYNWDGRPRVSPKT
jgi:hypothetical protein